MLVRPQIINPEFFRPRIFLGGFPIEKKHVRLDALCVEDACGQSQQRMQYLNLASRMKLTDINQLWVADITYIRLQSEFVYLAVILDAFSRKVVGLALERTMATRLTKSALEQAIAARQPAPGLGPSFRSRPAVCFE